MPDWGDVLSAAFFDRDVHELARALLGQIVLSEIDGVGTAGRIVEVEAYGGADDPACHADRGIATERTRSMFGPAGIAYVYRIYGMYDCLNVVGPRGANGKASAVLIRAVEPVAGSHEMLRRRGISDPRNLTSGPGKLCQALGIGREFDGHSLTQRPLQLREGALIEPFDIECSARIGLNEKTCGESAHFPWRFTVRGSACLSR